jgi:hypothetical protein
MSFPLELAAERLADESAKQDHGQNNSRSEAGEVGER